MGFFICSNAFAITEIDTHENIFVFWQSMYILQIGRPKPPLDRITLTKLAEFGNKNWLSQNQMRAFGQFLGENKVKIELDLQQELVQRNHILDEYYEIKALDFLNDGKLV